MWAIVNCTETFVYQWLTPVRRWRYVYSMPTTQVAFRLEDELIERIDAYARRLAERTPGITYTRVDAARALLALALDVVEAETDEPPPPPAGAARKRSSR